jgi:hypothetical protein
MWKRLIAWLDRDLAVQHLASMDDRMLADIGLTRDRLRAEVMAAPPPAPPAEPPVEPDYIDTELCLLLATRF